jgi:hypothetical protein
MQPKEIHEACLIGSGCQPSPRKIDLDTAQKIRLDSALEFDIASLLEQAVSS